MRILVTGSSGFIGSALLPALSKQGHQLLRLTRKVSRSPNHIFWDPMKRQLEFTALKGIDQVIHLAGKPIASGRWTTRNKSLIRSSRVQGTRLLVNALAQLTPPPKTFLCASAIGYYGDRADELLMEESASGDGFLAEMGRRWEQATEPILQMGSRVAHLRFGLVLHPTGGALAKMLPLFRLGLGGPLGNGQQYVSWITLEDAVRAILYTLKTSGLSGAVNVAAPQSVTNREFVRQLGVALRRPTALPISAYLLRLMLGEMADETLLASTRAYPRKLQASGFTFRHPDLAQALQSLLRKP